MAEETHSVRRYADGKLGASLVNVPFVIEDTLMFGGTPWFLPGPATEADAPSPWWDGPPAVTLFARAADEDEAVGDDEDDDEDDDDDDEDEDEGKGDGETF